MSSSLQSTQTHNGGVWGDCYSAVSAHRPVIRVTSSSFHRL